MKPTRLTSPKENLPDSLKNLPPDPNPVPEDEYFEDGITRALEKFVKEQKKNQQQPTDPQQEPDEVVLDGMIRTLKEFLKEKKKEKKKSTGKRL